MPKIPRANVVFVCVALSCCFVLLALWFLPDFDRLEVFGLLVALLTGSLVAFSVRTEFFTKLGASAAYPLVLGMLPAVAFLSNSYIVFEDAMTRYLLCTIFTIFIMLFGMHDRVVSLRLAGLLALTRISSWVGSCRDTQMPFCYYANHRQFPVNLPLEWYYFLGLFVALCVLVMAGLQFIRPKRMTAMLWFSLLHSGVFVEWLIMWYLDTNSGNIVDKDIWRYYDDLLGKVLFSVFLLGMLLHKGCRIFYMILFFGLVQRPFTGYVSLCVIYAQFPLLQQLFDALPSLRRIVEKQRMRHFQVVLLYLLGTNLFFMTGHQFTLTSIHWESAYAVFLDPPKWVCALFVVYETFFGFFLPFLYFVPSLKKKYSSSESFISEFVGKYHFLVTWTLACLSLICFIMLKHLMLWGVFAPRFLYHLVYLILASFLQLLYCCISAIKK